jgi:hypothetical protein
MILSLIRLPGVARVSFAAAALKNIRGCAALGENASLVKNRQLLHEPAERGHKPMLGSLPCLFTMREESAFGYMTKVMSVPWSTAAEYNRASI